MSAEEIIHQLQLLPHPEGGYYRETYRSAEIHETTSGAKRNICTAIYYLLTGTDKSHFHRIQSDELWFFHQGNPLEINYIEQGKLKVVILGNDVQKGEVPFYRIPAHTWFASKIQSEKGYSLVSCTVSPGFDFADFEMAERELLLREFPELRKAIEEFTRG